MPEAGAPCLARHDLLWMAPAAWEAVLDRPSSQADRPLLEKWATKAWPVIVRRRFPDERTDRIPVGIALPPAHGKRRIALSISPAHVMDRKAGLSLRSAMPAAPSTWQAILAKVFCVAQACAIDPNVFGSLLWQSLTRLDYLTSSSDLDLLWPLPSAKHLRPLLTGLTGLTSSTPRIDGEILFSHGIAVNWRELHQALGHTDQVLGKSVEGVTLIPTRTLTGEEIVL